MKKTILTLFVLTCVANSTYSQKWENYFQFGVGTGYLMDANFSDTPLLQYEYGKTLNWFDLVVAIEYANSQTFKDEHISLLVKTKFDLVRIFAPDARHSVKLGVGSGIGTNKLEDWYDNEGNSYLYSISSLMASYEYKLVDKTWLGVFFNNYPDDNFFGLHYVGISVRRNL